MNIAIGALLAVIVLQTMYIEKCTIDIISLNKNLQSLENRAIKNGIKFQTQEAVYSEVCK
jgi:hypothetical protein